MLDQSEQTLLVTGGSGFIGQHLVARLLQLGHRVVVVDNHSTSHPLALRDGLTLIETDLSLLKGHELPPLSGIFHLASVAAPRLFMRDPFKVIKPNVQGTEMLINLAKDHGCRLIYTSSSEVYGNAANASQSMSETHHSHHLLLSEKSPYSAAKILGEELLRAVHNQGQDVAVIRLFNVYGPNMDPTLQGRGRVIPNFHRALVNNTPIPLEGDGSQSRTFTWIDDVVKALLELMLHRDPLPLVMNMGSQETTSIFELAKTMARVLNIEPEFEFQQRLSGDPDWRCPDCTLLREIIGWAPTTSLEVGLRILLTGEQQQQGERENK